MPYDSLHVYLKPYILLYADDTVLFSENKKELQFALISMQVYYCDNNKLIAINEKTKNCSVF